MTTKIFVNVAVDDLARDGLLQGVGLFLRPKIYG
jgi:hypothetical protein